MTGSCSAGTFNGSRFAPSASTSIGSSHQKISSKISFAGGAVFPEIKSLLPIHTLPNFPNVSFILPIDVSSKKYGLFSCMIFVVVVMITCCFFLTHSSSKRCKRVVFPPAPTTEMTDVFTESASDKDIRSHNSLFL